MRDEIRLYNKRELLREKCPSCGNFNHSIFYCDYINIRPDSKRVIENHINSYQIKRAFIFRQRKLKINSLNVKKKFFTDSNTKNTTSELQKMYKLRFNENNKKSKFVNSLTLLAVKKNFIKLKDKNRIDTINESATIIMSPSLKSPISLDNNFEDKIEKKKKILSRFNLNLPKIIHNSFEMSFNLDEIEQTPKNGIENKYKKDEKFSPHLTFSSNSSHKLSDDSSAKGKKFKLIKIAPVKKKNIFLERLPSQVTQIQKEDCNENLIDLSRRNSYLSRQQYKENDFMNYESIKSFDIYFPHNNIERVSQNKSSFLVLNLFNNKRNRSQFIFKSIINKIVRIQKQVASYLKSKFKKKEKKIIRNKKKANFKTQIKRKKKFIRSDSH